MFAELAGLGNFDCGFGILEFVAVSAFGLFVTFNLPYRSFLMVWYFRKTSGRAIRGKGV